MNGPTMRRRAEGSARRTVSPPRSTVRGTIAMSIASQLNASPRTGSLAGKKLMADSWAVLRVRHEIWAGRMLPQGALGRRNRRAWPRVASRVTLQDQQFGRLRDDPQNRHACCRGFVRGIDRTGAGAEHNAKSDAGARDAEQRLGEGPPRRVRLCARPRNAGERLGEGPSWCLGLRARA